MMGKGLAFGFALLLTGLVCLAQAQSPFSSFPPGTFSNKAARDPQPAGGSCTPGTNATNYLARTSGYDATHTDAFCNYINGLDTDSLFTGFDALVVPGTSTAGNGVLNLISSSFAATANGGPTFTADRGYTGTDSSTTVYLSSNYTPSSQASQFTQNSAHISVWSNTVSGAASGVSGGACLGITSGPFSTQIFIRYNDGNTYFRINDLSGSAGVSSSVTDGLYMANRSGASAEQGYRNGSQLNTNTTSSVALSNFTMPIVVLATNDTAGGVSFGCDRQIGMYSMGRSFNSTEATNFYNRTRTLGTSLGWP